ncbi:FMN-binding protein [Candidatus Poribacteria bacterium]|nr:FMN-binding protein [Candidatus Poribacteria bacterium]
MKNRIWTVVFLVIIVCISTILLDYVYVYTEPVVQQNQQIKIQKSVLEVLGIDYEEDKMTEVFSKSINIHKLDEYTIYRTGTGETAFMIEGPGLWGEISALVALEPDMETIKGLRVLENNETPGLGGQIAEDWFQDQFKGKKIKPEIRIIPYKKVKSVNEVEAISGATKTSKAFEKIINENIKIILKLNTYPSNP